MQAKNQSTAHAVVTGDVIRSSRFNGAALESLHHSLRTAAAWLERAFPDQLVGGVQLYRGDGIQFLVSDPNLGVRIALAFLSSLKAHSSVGPIHLRMLLGIGPVDHFPDAQGSGGDGTAYRLSGRGLDGMKVQDRFGFAADSSTFPADLVPLLDAHCGLLGALADDWTCRQAQCVNQALLGKTHEQIATALTPQVSRQAVSKSLNAAHWAAIHNSLVEIENLSIC